MTKDDAMRALAQHMAASVRLDPSIVTRSTLPPWSPWRGLAKPAEDAKNADNARRTK